jgi:hypothetical protein
MCLLNTLLLAGFCTRVQAQAEAPTPAITPAAAPLERNIAFEQLISRSVAPATLRFKDLNSQWRRLVINNQGNNDSYAYALRFGMPMFQDMLADLGIGVYYSKLQTVTLGDETYLIAYRVQNEMTQQELQMAMQRMYGRHGHGEDDAPQGPRRHAPDTPLSLSLLNLRTSGSLQDIQTFDSSREILRPQDIIELSTANLRRIGGYFPRMSRFEQNGMRGLPLRDATEARLAFHNFFHAPDEIFLHPGTREPYRPNTMLAGKRLSLLGNSKQLVAFYEPRVGSDGKRGAVFLNGVVERIPEWQWKSVIGRRPAGLSARQIETLSMKNLQQLGRQLRRYASYTNGSLPPMKDAATVRRALSSYFDNAIPHAHPTTKAAYRPNPALSSLKLRNIANAKQLVAFYEATPGSDGKRGAVFLDGHIERVSSARWARVLANRVKSKAAPVPKRRA